MNVKIFVQDFIAVSNAYDTKSYLKNWHKTAVLADPSVGKVFKGHSGVKKYFEDYFIGYKTQTKLVKLSIMNDDKAHLEVEFTGEFPGSRVGGIFELTFKDGKISAAKANLK